MRAERALHIFLPCGHETVAIRFGSHHVWGTSVFIVTTIDDSLPGQIFWNNQLSNGGALACQSSNDVMRGHVVFEGKFTVEFATLRPRRMPRIRLRINAAEG